MLLELLSKYRDVHRASYSVRVESLRGNREIVGKREHGEFSDALTSHDTTKAGIAQEFILRRTPTRISNIQEFVMDIRSRHAVTIIFDSDCARCGVYR